MVTFADRGLGLTGWGPHEHAVYELVLKINVLCQGQ